MNRIAALGTALMVGLLLLTGSSLSAARAEPVDDHEPGLCGRKANGYAATGASRLVPPGDAGSLASSIGGLLGDPEARAELAAAAAAAAAGPYSWDAVAASTLELYRELAAR